MTIATYLAFIAQEKKPDEVRFERRTVVEFSEVSVTAQLVRPEGDLLYSRGRTKFKSLVRSRANFLPELVESLEHF